MRFMMLVEGSRRAAQTIMVSSSLRPLGFSIRLDNEHERIWVDTEFGPFHSDSDFIVPQ